MNTGTAKGKKKVNQDRGTFKKSQDSSKAPERPKNLHQGDGVLAHQRVTAQPKSDKASHESSSPTTKKKNFSIRKQKPGQRDPTRREDGSDSHPSPDGDDDLPAERPENETEEILQKKANEARPNDPRSQPRFPKGTVTENEMAQMMAIRKKVKSERTKDENETVEMLNEKIKVENAQFGAARSKDNKTKIKENANDMQIRAKWAAEANLKYIKDTGKEPTRLKVREILDRGCDNDQGRGCQAGKEIQGKKEESQDRAASTDGEEEVGDEDGLLDGHSLMSLCFLLLRNEYPVCASS